MSNEILVALISGGLALIGVIVTAIINKKSTDTKIQVALAVTDTKLENLTAEVRKHNNFAERLPVVEEDIKHIFHEIDEMKGK